MGRIYILEKNCTYAKNKMRKDNILFLLHSAFLKLIFCQIVGFLIVFYTIYFLAAIFAIFSTAKAAGWHEICICGGLRRNAAAGAPARAGLIGSDKFGHLILYFYFLLLGGGKPRPYIKRLL
jgi:hypothetical protein